MFREQHAGSCGQREQVSEGEMGEERERISIRVGWVQWSPPENICPHPNPQNV